MNWKQGVKRSDPKHRGTQRIVSVNYLFGKLLIPSDFLVAPVIHCRSNLSTSWTWTEIGCLAISVRARIWFASSYFNSINLQSFNVLNAKQHSKLIHYCVLTNLKRFGESKTSRFQKISLRLLRQPFTVLFTHKGNTHHAKLDMTADRKLSKVNAQCCDRKRLKTVFM